MLSRELEQERRNVAQQLEKVSQGVRVLIPILNSCLGTLMLFRAGHGPRSRSNLNFARRVKRCYKTCTIINLSIFSLAVQIWLRNSKCQLDGKVRNSLSCLYTEDSQDKLEYSFI